MEYRFRGYNNNARVPSQTQNEKVKDALIKMGLLKKKKSSFSENFQNDLGNLVKGLITLPYRAGKAVINNPKESLKTTGRFLRETERGLNPFLLSENIKNVFKPKETMNRVTEDTGIFGAIKRYGKLNSFEDKERTFNERVRSFQNEKSGTKGAKIAGEAFVKDIAELLTNPKRTIYERPVSSALDIISLGGGKAISAGARTLKPVALNTLKKTATGQKVIDSTNKFVDGFNPTGSLERMGYKEASDLLRKKRNQTEKSTLGIIEKEKKDFAGYTKEERKLAQQAIDKERRTTNHPTSKNKRVQGLIDMYLEKKVKLIQKDSGIVKSRNQKTKFHQSEVERLVKDIETKKIERNAKYNEKRIKIGETKLKKQEERQIKAIEKKYNENNLKPTKYSTEEIIKSGLQGKKIKKTVVPKERIVAIREKKALKIEELKKRIEAKRTALKVKKENPTKGRNIKKLETELKNNQKLLKEYSKAPLPNYIHHYFPPSKEMYKRTGFTERVGGYLKKSEDKQGYIEDLLSSTVGVRLKAVNTNIHNSFVKGLNKKYGVAKENVKKTDTGFINKKTGEVIDEYGGTFLPRDLVEEIKRVESFSNESNIFMDALRGFNRNWKPLATSVRANYHVRNTISNFYNAVFLAGQNPKVFLDTASGLIAKGISELHNDSFFGKLLKPLFKGNVNAKYVKMGLQDNVIGKGFFGGDVNELVTLIKDSNDIEKLISNSTNPALIYKTPLFGHYVKGAQKFGQFIEDFFRLSLYTDSLKKGMSRVKAVERTDKYLFDYINGLGKTDHFIKAFIPFWSWTRFNTPLQAGALYKLPIRHDIANKLVSPEIQNQQQEDKNYQFLSDRDKKMGAIKIGEEMVDGKLQNKYMRTNGVLPVQDVSKIIDYLKLNFDEIGTTNVLKILKQLRYSINPAENPTDNLDYYGNPIEKYPGEHKMFLGTSMRGTTKEALSAIPALTMINKGIGGSYNEDNMPNVSERFSSLVSPVSTFNSDPKQNIDNYIYNFTKETQGAFDNGYEGHLRKVIRNIVNSENPNQALQDNKDILIGLLKDSGYTDKNVVEIIIKSIINDAKNKSKQQQYESILDGSKN